MKKKYNLLVLLLLVSVIKACDSKTTESQTEPNPAADGFNEELSDEKAIKIADQVMLAMGGRKGWDETRYLSWNFFGSRKHLWDKHSGDIRIEMPANEITILMNIHSKQGKAKKGNKVYTEPDSLNFFMERGYAWWVNDSYWLIMPFKLKDSGVILKYHSEDSIENIGKADVLELTFEGVGVTPQNKYHVYVDQQDHLVKQWAFYSKAENEEPNFVAPWDNYQKHGKILLSGSRIGERKISDIQVMDSVDTELFSEF